MLMMPELAAALRRELLETVNQCRSEVVQLSTWSKCLPQRAADYVAALERPLMLALWERGAWQKATQARDELGGELASLTDIATGGELWLFESISLPPAVRKRFTLPPDARVVGRVLLPLGPPEESRWSEFMERPEAGIGMGYLLRTAARRGGREGLPLLRLLPDLYPGEFLADPHVNFAAARRYLSAYGIDVTPPGERHRSAPILCVPEASMQQNPEPRV